MADATSALTGIITFGCRVISGVSQITQLLEEASEDMRALSNDANDIDGYLEFLQEAHRVGPLFPENMGSTRRCSVESLMDSATKSLEEIDHIVTKVAASGKDRLRITQRLRHAGRVKKMREEMQTLKSTLNGIVNQATLHSCTAIRSALQQLILHESITSAIVREMAEERRDIVLLLGRIEDDRTLRSTVATVSTAQGHSDGLRAIASFESRSLPELQPRLALPFRAARDLSRPGHLKCRNDCQCRCHRLVSITSPNYLSSFFGSFFVRYTGLSRSSLAECNDQTCTGGHLHAWITCLLPSWFTTRMSFAIDQPRWSICIQSRREVPSDSEIFKYAWTANMDDIKKLLCAGTASLNDVDDKGWNVLHHVLFFFWNNEKDTAMAPAVRVEKILQAIRFFLEHGAHAEWRDVANDPAIHLFIDHLWAQGTSSEQGSPIKPDELLLDAALAFGRTVNDIWEDYLESRAFTDVHEALLGIHPDGTDLAEFLGSISPESRAQIIDKVDARGWSPLAWAVYYCWPSCVATLLEFGANPHQRTYYAWSHGNSSLLHLVLGPPFCQSEDRRIRSLLVFQILLSVGVDINARAASGWTPLHVAACFQRYDIAVELSRCEGSRLDWDARTPERDTAFDLAYRKDWIAEQPGSAELLDLLQSRTS